MDLAGRGPLGQKEGNAKRGTAAGKRHMDRVRELDCVLVEDGQCWGIVSAHHCIVGRGKSFKSADEETIPLCYHHHQGAGGIHTLGSKAWARLHGSDWDFLPIVKAMLEGLI